MNDPIERMNEELDRANLLRGILCGVSITLTAVLGMLIVMAVWS